ncbi:DUF6301 family protein [Actinoplanes rectilineatus]|uniref:DUF6301 family protein n=1 Tax=Actinoplanes rectilineatus TaxID=113571 RepID=UPI0012F83EE3|nr:DUF6301 family protein [Actinoplanes rectilineatus]
MVDARVLRETLRSFRDVEWDWSAAGLPVVAERLGWEPAAGSVPEVVQVFDPHFGVATGVVEIPVIAGTVKQIMLRLTDVIPDADPAGENAVQDAFVDAVAVATEVLGEPSGREAGELPHVVWRGPSSTVRIERYRKTAVLVWLGNAVADRLARVEERDAVRGG